MASNMFKVLALIPLLQCACYGALIDIGVKVNVSANLCLSSSKKVDVLTTLITNLTSTPITAKSCSKAPFTGHNELTIIIADYFVPSDCAEMTGLVDATIKANVKLNVILVDIRPILKELVGFVGAVVDGVSMAAKSLLKLIKSVLHSRTEITKLHCIGLGLGAQISGKLASLLKVEGIVMANLTALSPHGPLMKESLVSTEVATFVDVYHSNVGILGFNGLCGHVDIILADGKCQPGCPSAAYPSADLCSLISSLLYYTQIVNGKSVVGKTCVDLGVSFPKPKNDCQKTYSSFKDLDIAVKATVCALGGGDSVTMGHGHDLSQYSGSALVVSAQAMLGIL